MKSWLRSISAVGAGLLVGSAAQAQSEPSKHPLEPAGYVQPPSSIPGFSDFFPAQNPLQVPPAGAGVPANQPLQYEAEPDINGKPKVYHEPNTCPWFPVLDRIIFGDAIFVQPYLNGNYTAWTMRSAQIPFAIATTSVSGLRQGTIGDPDTRIVLGNSKLDFGTYSGPAISGGAWFANSDVGLETSYFTLGKQSVSGGVTGAQFPVLARPFYDTNIGGENVLTISSPGLFSNGSVAYSASSQMWGIDIDAVFRLANNENSKFDLIVGGKYMRLQEDLYISSSSTGDPINGVINFAGNTYLGSNTLVVVDGTKTIVQFYGGTVGSRYSYTIGQFTLTGTAKVTLGEEQSTIIGQGQTILNPGVGQSTANGGLTVVGLNNTRRQDDKIAWMPEVGAGVTWSPLTWASFNLGYNFAYLSRVARPGDQFDRNVNPTLIPASSTYGVPFGSASPSPRVDTSDMWFSSFNFGITIRF